MTELPKDIGTSKEVRSKTVCGLYDNNREALGWAIDVVPRGVTIVGNVVFSSTALLTLAKQAAGCETELQPGQIKLPECTKTVYGIRPSSLLTTIMLAVGLCSALLMPIVGAIIDHTSYRRAGGRISAVVMTIITFFQIFISEDTWFFISILQVISAFFYIVHSLMAMAYLPELTDDNKLLTKYTGTYTAWQYGGMVIYLIGIVAAQTIFSITSEVISARIAQIVSFIISLTFFSYAWSVLFRARPVSQIIPENQWILTAGFRKLWRTATTILMKNVSIKWFLVSLAFTESGVSSFSTVAITFLSDQLQFSSSENGIAILLLLFGTIPGALLSTRVSEKLNPVKSLQIALFIWVINTIIAALTLKGPEQGDFTYAFALIWGIATGWTYPMERTIYCTIIPKGQEAEMMGVYSCTTQIISWLPPLVFTALNEAGVNMRVSIASLCIFFGISFGVLFIVEKDYDSAVEKVNNSNVSSEEKVIVVEDGEKSIADRNDE